MQCFAIPFKPLGPKMTKTVSCSNTTLLATALTWLYDFVCHSWFWEGVVMYFAHYWIVDVFVLGFGNFFLGRWNFVLELLNRFLLAAELVPEPGIGLAALLTSEASHAGLDWLVECIFHLRDLLLVYPIDTVDRFLGRAPSWGLSYFYSGVMEPSLLFTLFGFFMWRLLSVHYMNDWKRGSAGTNSLIASDLCILEDVALEAEEGGGGETGKQSGVANPQTGVGDNNSDNSNTGARHVDDTLPPRASERPHHGLVADSLFWFFRVLKWILNFVVIGDEAASPRQR
jgi:hypothetical protein